MGKKLDKLKFRFTMRNTILILCLGCTIFALLLQAIIFQVSSSGIIRNENAKDSSETLVKMQSELGDLVHDISIEMLSIYSETGLISGMRRRAAYENDMSKYYWIAWDIARNKFSTDDGLVALYIYDSNDEVISAYRSTVLYYPRNIYDSELTTDFNEEKVLDYVHSDDNEMLISGYYNASADKNIVRMVLKLHNYDTERKEFGYLVCDFDSKGFTDIMQKYASSKNVLIWLQPTSDRAIAISGDITDSNRNEYKNITRDIRTGGSLENLGGEYGSYYLASLKSDENCLNAFILSPQSLVMATQKSLIKNLILISLAMIALSFVLVAYISELLSKPVEKMKDVVISIKNGDDSVRVVPIGWSEELSVLGIEFNEMLDMIQKMAKEEYESKMIVERTEYKALQAQINPHFLYNTLDTMSGIANSQNCLLVSGLCQSLSAIFRYCMNMSDSCSTMKQEMAHVRNYLYVMDVRNDSAVRYEFRIDPETLEDEIPRISIQPIVENALSHGLRNIRGDDKKLIISAEHIHGENGVLLLKIYIIDNGCGMDVTSINEELEKNDPSRVEVGHSIGLLNVNSRLKRYFGNEYGIYIDSKPGEGARVIITVPVRREGAENGEGISGTGC